MGSEIILPEECLCLSEISQSGVKAVLGRIQRMNEGNLWLQERTSKELSIIIPQVHSVVQGMYRDLRPFKMEYWSSAWEEAHHKSYYADYYVEDVYHPEGVDEVAQEEGKKLRVAWDSVSEAAWGMIPDNVRNRGSSVAHAVALIAARGTVNHVEGLFINPFLSALGLIELGAARFGFRFVDDQEKLVVDFPIREKDEYAEHLIACLVFGDGELGDREVLYVHEPGQECSQIRPIRPSRVIGG